MCPYVFQVLFPLLDRVKGLSGQASDRRDDNGSSGGSRSGTSGGGGNILMHHSRDTAEKQWAETRFLTLAGVARVFNAKRRTLQQLGMSPAGTDVFFLRPLVIVDSSRVWNWMHKWKVVGFGLFSFWAWTVMELGLGNNNNNNNSRSSICSSF